ncbi:hypothetical protein ACTFIY_004217 [Dictyostelium cf. discoideum]
MASFLWRITTLLGIIILSISVVSIILPWYKTESVSRKGRLHSEYRYYLSYYEIDKTDTTMIDIDGQTPATSTSIITRNYYQNLQLIQHTLQISFYFLVLGMGFTFVNLIVLIFFGKKTLNKTIAILVINSFSTILFLISSLMTLHITEDFKNSQDVLPACKSTYCNSFIGKSFNTYKTFEYTWRPDLGWIIVTVAMGLSFFQLIAVIISTVLVCKKGKKTKSWKEIIEDAQLSKN